MPDPVDLVTVQILRNRIGSLMEEMHRLPAGEILPRRGIKQGY